MAALVGLLLLIALVTSLALVIMATLLRHDTTSMAMADARMRASLRTKVALLWYARASDLAVSDRSPAAWAERERAESDLHSALAETRRLATPQRLDELNSLKQKGQDYIALRDRLDAEGLPVGLILKRSTPALEAVFGDLQRIIDADDAWARSVEAAARRWDALANGLGISAAALLTLGFAGAIVGASLLVERPILALTRAMARFAGGEESARGEPHGARELRQMSATFNQLADQLVREKRDRLAFLSGIAHDLRNPLSALRLAIGARGRGAQPLSQERAARTVDLVARQVERLDRMVGDLLDATRIEAGRLELRMEVADLRSLIGDVVELFSPITTTHEILVHAPEEPLLVDCDSTRIEQVLTNLVSNALKYSPNGGPVTVDASVVGSDAVVSVTDRGIGISPEDQERIFEPFHRTGESRALVPGVGLGLSVARKIVEAHGGHMEVESQVGRGSTFRFKLRRASAD